MPKQPPTARVTRRRRTYLKAYGKIAATLLQTADEAFKASAGLDTAVRDSISQGLAHVVEAAFDSEAVARGYEGIDFDVFVLKATAQWFREREYTEWFCEAAAVCFRSSRPRTNFTVSFSKARYKPKRPKPRTKQTSAKEARAGGKA